MPNSSLTNTVTKIFLTQRFQLETAHLTPSKNKFRLTNLLARFKVAFYEAQVHNKNTFKIHNVYLNL